MASYKKIGMPRGKTELSRQVAAAGRGATLPPGARAIPVKAGAETAITLSVGVEDHREGGGWTDVVDGGRGAEIGEEGSPPPQRGDENG